MILPVEILYSVIDAYLIRSILLWPSRFRDKETLRKLYAIIFAKIADMQFCIFEGSSKYKGMSASTDFDYEAMASTTMAIRFRNPVSKKGAEQLAFYFEAYKSYKKRTKKVSLNMENEITDVLDTLWNITKEIQEYVYPEPNSYNWDFEYGVDDWRKLIHLQRQHPEETLRNMYRKMDGP